MRKQITKQTTEQVDALYKAFQESKNPNEKIRYQGLWLLAKRYPRKFVAEVTGRSIDALREWVTLYHQLGIGGLRIKKRQSNNGKLRREQKEAIKNLIKRNRPEELGYGRKFWDIEVLKKLVWEKYKVEYRSKESYRQLFIYSGFSFHRPNKVNRKQDGHMKKRFAEHIKKNFKDTEGKIVWYW